MCQGIRHAIHSINNMSKLLSQLLSDNRKWTVSSDLKVVSVFYVFLMLGLVGQLSESDVSLSDLRVFCKIGNFGGFLLVPGLLFLVIVYSTYTSIICIYNIVSKDAWSLQECQRSIEKIPIVTYILEQREYNTSINRQSVMRQTS